MDENSLEQKVIVAKESRVNSISQTINFFADRDSWNLARDQRNKKILLERVKQFWIDQVLDKSLHQIACIQLGIEETNDEKHRPWDMLMQLEDYIPYKISPDTKIHEVFVKSGKNLLLLGEPGSGKTTMLLELTKDAISQSENNLTLPIPIVLPLSSWTDAYASLQEWVLEELNSHYFIPEKIGKEWLDNDELLLVFDGLDEIKQRFRKSFVKKYNHFRSIHGFAQTAISSRKLEYSILDEPLEVSGVIEIQRLRSQQVIEFLNRADTKLAGVMEAITKDPLLLQLVKSPLMLNVMALAYHDKSAEEIGVIPSVIDRRRHLFSCYINKMFHRTARTRNDQYSIENTVKWLAWLAERLENLNMTIFSVDQLQPWWLKTRNQFRLYRITSWITLFFIYSTLSSLTGSPTAGLYVGLLMGSMIFYFNLAIRPISSIGWSLPDGIKSFGATASITIVLITATLSLIFWFGYIKITGIEPTVWLNYWVSNIYLRGLLLFFSSALVALLFLGITTNTVTHNNNKPNWPIWKTGQVILLFLSLTTLISFVLFGLPGNLFNGILPMVHPGSSGSFINGLPRWLGGPLMGIIVGIGGITPFALYAFIHHFILRFFLYVSGYTPWRYVRFLEFATERIFLQRVGGSYIFIHRLLLEYFAELAKSGNPKSRNKRFV